MKFNNNEKAILAHFSPGFAKGKMESAIKALADILFGSSNPSGKIPYTYPRYDGVVEHYDQFAKSELAKLSAAC